MAATQASLDYNNLLIEPLITARRELGFELDAEVYRAMSKAINARLQKEIEKMVAILDGMFADQ